MAAPDVRQLLDIMQVNVGSFVLVEPGINVMGLANLIIPGQPKLPLDSSKTNGVIEWLKKDDMLVDGRAKYTLEDTTMDYIRSMERRSS